MGDVVVDKDISLKWKMPEKPECFFGREMELKTLEQFLAGENKTVFIQGIGGIGKSELAATYAIEHRADYDVIVFANCVSDIQSMIASDVEFPLDNMRRNTFDEYFLETEEEYFIRKFEIIKEVITEKTLLIVDNFNQKEDSYLDEFLTLLCDKIITSRNDWSSKRYPILKLYEIADEHELEKIFEHYYVPKEEEVREQIHQIIQKVGGHTLAIEWIAKQLAEQTVTPSEMVQILEKHPIDRDLEGAKKEQELFDMLSGIFRVDQLDEKEKEVLRLLCFVPYTGISKEDIVKRGRKGTHTAVLKLLRSSWLKQVELDVVTLHPVVAETVIMELKPDWENTKLFFDSIASELMDDDLPIKQIDNLLVIAERIFRTIGMKEPGAVPMLLGVSHALLKRYRKYSVSCDMLQIAYKLQGSIVENIKVKIALCKEKNALDVEYSSLKEQLLEATSKKANILHQIGDIYYLSGKNDKALECYMKLSSNPMVDIHCDIAKVYAKANEYRKAAEYVEAGIKIKQRKYGDNELPLVENYLLMARICSKNGNNRLGQECVAEAKRIADSQMNKEEQSNFYYNLAVLLKEIGRVEEALGYDQTCFAQRCKLYGEEHLAVVYSYAAMAVDYYRLGDYVSALECSLREIKIRRRLRRVKKRLYMSVSRLIGYVEVSNLPEDMQADLKTFMSDFNWIIKENPQEGQEMLRQ